MGTGSMRRAAKRVFFCVLRALPNIDVQPISLVEAVSVAICAAPIASRLELYAVKDDSQNPGTQLMQPLADGAHDVLGGSRASDNQYSVDDRR